MVEMKGDSINMKYSSRIYYESKENVLTSPTRRRRLVSYLAWSLKGGSFISIWAGRSDLRVNHSSDRANSPPFVSGQVPAFLKSLPSPLNCCLLAKVRWATTTLLTLDEIQLKLMAC